MSIGLILDEIKFAKEILDGKHNYLSDFGVAKYLSKYKSYIYYKDSNNTTLLNVEDVYDFVVAYLKKIHKSYDEIENYKAILNICKRFSKKNIYIIKSDGIHITLKELNKIKTLNNRHLEVLAFVILVLKKADNIKFNEKSNIFNKKLKDFYQKYTKDTRNNLQQNKAIKRLVDNGLLSLPPIEDFGKNASLRINYMDFNDEKYEILINDFREISLIYLKWIGENIIHCEQCGKLIEKKSNRTKYCDVCAKQINIQKTIKNKQKLQKFEIENLCNP